MKRRDLFTVVAALAAYRALSADAQVIQRQISGQIGAFGTQAQIAQVGGPSFLPTDVPNLKLWLAADKIVGVPEGGVVGTWPDASGQSNDGTEATTKPLYRGSVINGKPGVDFSPAGSKLTTPSFLGAAFNTGFSYYAVVNHTASGLKLVSSNGGSFQWYHGSSGTESANTGGLATTNKTLGENPAHLFGFRYDGATEKLVTNGPVQTNSVGFNGARTAGRSFANTGNLGLSGALTIGQLVGGGFEWDGQICEMLVYLGALSDANDALVCAYLNQKYNFLAPFAKQVIFAGNSLTSGYQLSSPSTQSYAAQTIALLGSTQWGYTNLGITGLTTTQIAGNASTAIDTFFDYRCAKNIVAIWEVRNDLVAIQNAATCYSNYVTLCQGRQAAGHKVVAFTLIPSSVAGSYAAFETDRQTVNTNIRANWATFADAFCDVGADATIGVAGAETNTTYYQGDQIHLTATGAGIVAALANTAIAAL